MYPVIVVTLGVVTQWCLIFMKREIIMRLQGQKQGGVKIAIQPYPYVKGESKGKNKSLVILEASTEEVHKFIVEAFEQLDDE
jgi:hypothetical protein